MFISVLTVKTMIIVVYENQFVLKENQFENLICQFPNKFVLIMEKDNYNIQNYLPIELLKITSETDSPESIPPTVENVESSASPLSDVINFIMPCYSDSEIIQRRKSPETGFLSCRERRRLKYDMILESIELAELELENESTFKPNTPEISPSSSDEIQEFYELNDTGIYFENRRHPSTEYCKEFFIDLSTHQRPILDSKLYSIDEEHSNGSDSRQNQSPREGNDDLNQIQRVLYASKNCSRVRPLTRRSSSLDVTSHNSNNEVYVRHRIIYRNQSSLLLPVSVPISEYQESYRLISDSQSDAESIGESLTNRLSIPSRRSSKRFENTEPSSSCCVKFLSSLNPFKKGRKSQSIKK